MLFISTQKSALESAMQPCLKTSGFASTVLQVLKISQGNSWIVYDFIVHSTTNDRLFLVHIRIFLRNKIAWYCWLL